MSWLIDNGKAFYWGTSEWQPDWISRAIEMCERLNLHKPIVEQPQYSMIIREKFENGYRRIFSEYKYGSTIWSPLRYGVLTGKYNDGNIPEDSRLGKEKGFFSDTIHKYFGEENKEKFCGMLIKLGELAKENGYS